MEETQISEQNAGMIDDAEDLPDVELMRLAGAGDLQAFDVIVRRHQHAVIGTAAKMLGSESEAHDIAQQVFIRAWKSAGRYTPTAKFTTWLMTITRNLVFNETRRRGRAKVQSFEIETPEEIRPLEVADKKQRTADVEASQAELQAAIDRALAKLPEKHRMAVVLRRYENMPYEEIAAVLQVSVPAVKSLLFRARADLRDQLAEWL